MLPATGQATVTPFPGYEGATSVAMGDFNDDNVLDLAVGAGDDHAPKVVVYSGQSEGGKAPFTAARAVRGVRPEARGGVSVTAAQIDGTVADNIIVGSGPGTPSEVRIFGTELPRRRERCRLSSRPSTPMRMIARG